MNKIGSPDSVMASTPAGLVSSSDGALHRGSYGVAILGEPATQVFSNGIRIACNYLDYLKSQAPQKWLRTIVFRDFARISEGCDRTIFCPIYDSRYRHGYHLSAVKPHKPTIPSTIWIFFPLKNGDDGGMVPSSIMNPTAS